MLRFLFKRFADNTSESSVSLRMRRRRFELLDRLLDGLATPITIIDLGGSPEYWTAMLDGRPELEERLEITLVNLLPYPSSSPRIRNVGGDARSLEFADQSFDLAFSNSTIEHVGALPDQRRMALEVLRVGRRHCVQTPNRYFPIEPHFVFPFFQFLPVNVRVALLRRFDLGWQRRERDPLEAHKVVTGIRLLSRRELRRLFPTSEIFEERFLGLVKSFVAHSPVARLHDGAPIDRRETIQ